MNVQAYLSFEGRCEEALEFYRTRLGAEITRVMRFKEMPAGDGGPAPTPESAEKIMHSSFRIGDTILMASDGQCTGKASFEGISLTLGLKEPAEAERLFAALSDGGEVSMPLTKTFFSPAFGMVSDRFGVSWMVIAGEM